MTPSVPKTSPEAPSLESIADLLRERISRGESLPAERKLVAELGITRHSLRKVLKHLRASGVLSARSLGTPAALAKNKTTLARDTNPIEVIELRMALEPMLARLAALRATPLDIARIERAAVLVGENNTGVTDLSFHKLVAAATQNRLAAELYALLRQVGADVRVRVQRPRPQPAERLKQRSGEHAKIAAAIAARDPDLAEKAMRQHLHMVQRQILDRMAPGSSTSTDEY